MNLIDKQPLEGIRTGDPSTFQVVFNEHYPALAVFAQKFLPDPDLAKEIVQDVFVQLYEKRETINIETSLKSYLYQSVRNGCLNRIRQDKTHRKHHEEILRSTETDSGWTDYIVETELKQKIFHIVSNLPPKCREIFLLSRQEDLSNREISEKLNISIRTVENQITSALKALRESIDL